MDIYFLGGHDLEMQEIARVLQAHRCVVVDKLLAWSGATCAAYATEIAAALQRGDRPILVEIRDVPPDVSAQVDVIDHHNDLTSRPTSLEQVLARLGQTALTREDELIIANDVGHVAAMLAVGATPAEISRIRLADRRAQGVTASDENAAESAIAQRESPVPGLTVVRLPHGRTATVTDRLHRAVGGPGYDNLLIESPGEVNFFGDGGIIQSLARTFGGFCGGQLPRTGYWGLETSDEHERARVTEFVRNAVDGSRALTRAR